MTTKVISTTYAAGYTLSGTNQTVSITAAGYVGGTGISTGPGATGAYTIENAGTIHAGGNDAGVDLQAGGRILNGSAADTTALIEGGTGIWIAGAIGTVRNLGTIGGATLGRYGILLGAGGIVVNGSAADTTALIDGVTGLWIAGAAGTIVNNGTIDATGLGRYGVALSAGGTITNGGPAERGALIEGATGVSLYGAAATVVNFGTIDGRHGTALSLGSSGDALVLEAGATFVGTVAGDGGTLRLAASGGPGTLTGSRYAGFGAIDVVSGAVWTLEGTNTVDGTLTNGGSLTVAGSLDIEGRLVNAGTLDGDLVLGGPNLEASLSNGAGRTIAGTGIVVKGLFGTVTNQGLLTATGNGGIAIEIQGVVAVVNGSRTDGGAAVSGVTAIGGDATTVTNFGTIDGTGGIAVAFAGRVIDEGGAVFDGTVECVTLELASGGGAGTIADIPSQFTIDDLRVDGGATWTLGGNVAGAGLTNFGTIKVAGLLESGLLLGNGTTDVESGATFDAKGTIGLAQTIDFVGSGGDLVLATFDNHGSLLGLGGSNAIDVPGATITPDFVADASGGTLTLLERFPRREIAKFTLFGQYAAAGFHAASDGHNGTLITYTPPPAPALQLAQGH